jgi:Putative amidoligase enzyme
MILCDLLGLTPVARKNFPKAANRGAKDPSLLYGVELEIEGVPHWADLVVPGMDCKADGSLRNNGREFITAPMTYSNLAYCLELFFTKAKLTGDNYSERCSIHVHTNVQDMTWDQIQTLTLIYQVVERVLFRWIGAGREENIFCVPLHQTAITYNTIGSTPDSDVFRGWEKYTAFNFLPMFTQGTVEWRHMHGHCDVDKILQWCQIIGSIFSYARRTQFDVAKKIVVELNTNS